MKATVAERRLVLAMFKIDHISSLGISLWDAVADVWGQLIAS
jgi:hypothetical protein